MADFTIKQNDNRPDLEVQLKSGGSVIDLSTASSVTFHLDEISAAATITDAVNGIVKYEWAAGDTDLPIPFNVPAKTYLAEFEVEWNNGDIQTFPNSDHLEIDIVREVA